MTAESTNQALLSEHRFQWQPLLEFLSEQGVADTDIERLEKLAIASPYALGHLQQHPHWAIELLALQQFALDTEIVPAASEARIDLDQVKRELRLYRHRKLVQIIYLDVVGKAALDEVLHWQSDLAQQLIEAAVSASEVQLSAKHGQPLDDKGQPMSLNVIAMGKLGGRELNFSSDIDLICCYEQDGELEGYGQLSYQEYFSRVTRQMTQLLGDATAEGFVYRVDLRLRPWGDSGPVVLSHSALEHYYQLHGREWEQYAMVKARVITGSDASRESLARLLRPFVYRKYLDYRVFDGLATLKSKIDRQARARGMRINIKLGQGGIREIEFFVQAFQILRGGRNHQLQCSSIFDSFEALEKYGIVEADTLRPLRDAYRFLRWLENRIQMYEDRQTHDLPDAENQQRRLAASMEIDSWDEILNRLQQHRDFVSGCFRELFDQHETDEPAAVFETGIDDSADAAQHWEFIDNSGIADAEEISQHLNHFIRSKAWKFMSARARQRFSLLLPGLIRTIAASEQASRLFERFLKLFSSIAGRSVYFELLYQNQPLLERLASLFDRSEWIANEVADYPMLLENLIQAEDGHRFDKAALARRLQQQLSSIDDDVELELDVLRLFKREQTLVIASAELAGEIKAVDVGRYLCDLAEVVLDAVYELALKTIQQRHGDAECVDEGERRLAKLAIIGYGKLGGHELHYQSDLDLIFLHDSRGSGQMSNGAKPLENSVYFARLAQKIISLTSVLTASGKLYEIDSRLRPEGSSGLLVSPLDAYRRYQLEKAWTWEHQALVRARLVAGSRDLCEGFAAIREEVLCLPRDGVQLAQDIVDMRERMYRAKRPPEGDQVNLKHSRGGMVDIEFLVQFWVLSQANSIGSECLYSDNISLLNALHRSGLISKSQSRLADIYQSYHRLLHESVLQNQTDEIDADLIAGEMAQVKNCWDDSFSLLEK